METNKLPALNALPPGEYWVGDPCYVEWDGHSEWMEFCESMLTTGHGGYAHQVNVAHTTDRRHWFVCSGTMYGDGEYEDREGNRYPVDAGIIGVVPKKFSPTSPFGMHLRKFDKPFTVGYDEGIISIGHYGNQIVINTGDEENEIVDWEDEDEDE